MIDTSVVAAAFDALQAQLAAVYAATDGMEDVTVASGDLFEDTPPEALIFTGSDDWNQEWSAVGNLRKAETFTIDYFIWIVKVGKDEAVIREARTRAVAIQAVMETYLRGSSIHGDDVDGITLQGTVRSATVVPSSLFNGVHPQGRFCQVTGGVEIAISLRRS